MIVGIVGIEGKMGKRHSEVYDKLGVDWIGIDVGKKYLSYEGMLDCVDIVDVCTPTNLHYDMVMDALYNDKHAFCEKPLALTVTDVRDIVTLSEEKNKSCMVGYLYRFHPVYELLNEYNKAKLFGDVYYVIMRLGVKGADKDWKYNVEYGGACWEMMSHLLDLVFWIFGDDDFALTTLYDKIMREEDYIVIDGIGDKYKMLLIADLASPTYNNMIEVHGNKGSYIGSILPDVYTKVRVGDRVRRVNFGYVDMLKEELTYFINKIEDGERVTDGMETSEMIAEILNR